MIHTSNDSMPLSLTEFWLIVNCETFGRTTLDELRTHVGPVLTNESGHALWPPTTPRRYHASGRHALGIFSTEVLDYAEEWALRMQFWLNSGAFPRLAEWPMLYVYAAAPPRDNMYRVREYALRLLRSHWQHADDLRQLMKVDDTDTSAERKQHCITGSDIVAQHMPLAG